MTENKIPAPQEALQAINRGRGVDLSRRETEEVAAFSQRESEYQQAANKNFRRQVYNILKPLMSAPSDEPLKEYATRVGQTLDQAMHEYAELHAEFGIAEVQNARQEWRQTQRGVVEQKLSITTHEVYALSSAQPGEQLARIEQAASEVFATKSNDLEKFNKIVAHVRQAVEQRIASRKGLSDKNEEKIQVQLYSVPELAILLKIYNALFALLDEGKLSWPAELDSAETRSVFVQDVVWAKLAEQFKTGRRTEFLNNIFFRDFIQSIFEPALLKKTA